MAIAFYPIDSSDTLRVGVSRIATDFGMNENYLNDKSGNAIMIIVC